MKAVNPYVAGGLLLVAALLQTQFLPGLLPGVTQFVPDLVLLLVVAWALLLEWRAGLLLAFGAGLLLDLLSVGLQPLGFNALMFSLMALVISFLSQNPANASVIRAVPIMLVAALFYRGVRLLTGRFISYNNFQPALILQVVLPVVVIDAALMFLVFGLVRVFSRRRKSRE